MLKQFFDKIFKIKPVAQPEPVKAAEPPAPAPAVVTVTVESKTETAKTEPINISLTSDTITFPAASTVTVAESSPAVITAAPKKGGKGRPKNTKSVPAKPASKGTRKKK
jgi:hypothetical protein